MKRVGGHESKPHSFTRTRAAPRFDQALRHGRGRLFGVRPESLPDSVHLGEGLAMRLLAAHLGGADQPVSGLAHHPLRRDTAGASRR